MDLISCSPTDPSMWLTRPLGYWEKQMIVDWPPVTEGPRRCTCNNLTHITTKQDINVALFEQAVRATVHNEPHLRADVDLHARPECWVPATDFSELFLFQDVTELGHAGIEDIWSQALELVNKPWDYGSGKPLYRCVLVKFVGGFVVMNCYHHGAGDGTTGMLIMGGIMDHYNTLWAGNKIVLNPHSPKQTVEDLTNTIEEPEVLKAMLEKKIQRAKNYKPYLPFSTDELSKNREAPVPVNITIFREGSPDNYTAIRERCRKEQVTVGSLALASCYLAQAVVHAGYLGQDSSNYTGMTEQLIDIPVNVRRQIQPPIGDQYGGLYITELTTTLDINLSTKLWSLARDIGQQMKEMMAEKQHIIFSRAKELFETGENEAIAAAVAPEGVADMLVSNKRFYPFKMDFEWGEIRAVHSMGSYWTPGFANYLLLLQATKLFTYNLVHCPGDNNTAVANKLLNTFEKIMENSGHVKEDCSLKDILASLPQSGKVVSLSKFS